MNHGQQPGVTGMPNMVGISPSMMASSPQQQMPGMMGQQQNPAMAMPVQPQPTDNISKVKSLVIPLRESLSVSFQISFRQKSCCQPSWPSQFYIDSHPVCVWSRRICNSFDYVIFLQITLKQAAQLLQHNNMTDNGNL